MSLPICIGRLPQLEVVLKQRLFAPSPVMLVLHLVFVHPHRPLASAGGGVGGDAQVAVLVGHPLPAMALMLLHLAVAILNAISHRPLASA